MKLGFPNAKEGSNRMAFLLRFFALVLIMGGVVQASTAPALAVHSLPPNSTFSELTITPVALHLGENASLHVKLKHASNQITILTLTVTYPSGVTESVVHSTLGSEATIEWTVPPKAGAGRATYQIATGGCGCGDHNSIQADASQNVAEGSFAVE